MKVSVHNSTEEFTSYRAARVRSLFNAESGANFHLDLAGATRTPMPFKTLKNMWHITGVVGDLYLGKRTKPYHMKWNVYRWLSECSAHNRQLLGRLRNRGLIVGCDDA